MTEPGSSLLRLDLESFTDRLAGRTPTPGGGSMAAYLAATGAALTMMAFRFTSGEKYAAVQARLAEQAMRLDGLRRRSLELVDQDSSAYDAVTAAYKLPSATATEKASRSEAIQTRLRDALEIPLETMRAARDSLVIAAAGAGEINPNLASDCATGSWCLWSAAEAAALNVKINAGSIRDETYVRERLEQCERILGECRASAESIRSVASRLLA